MKAIKLRLQNCVGIAAEDADIPIILIHHFGISIHKEIRILTSKGHYSVNEIVNYLTPDEKLWILLCHSFSPCDTAYSIFSVKRNSAKRYVPDS